MAKVDDKLVAKIKKLGESSNKDDQKEMYLLIQKIFPNCICAKEDAIPALMPSLVKMLTFQNAEIQKHVAMFICNSIAAVHESNKKENAQLAIDAGAISQLVNLLESSTDSHVLRQTAMCLSHIARHFPEEVVRNKALPPLIKNLESNDTEICYTAAHCLSDISKKRENIICPIVETACIEPLKMIISYRIHQLQAIALDVMINLTSYDLQTCQRFIDYGLIQILGKFFTPTHRSIRLFLTEFIKNFTSFGEAQVDMVIAQNIIPKIINQMNGGITEEVTLKSIQIVQNVIKFKPGYIPTLIDDNVVFAITRNLKNENNAELLFLALSALKDIIGEVGYEAIKGKFKHGGGLKKLQNLSEHKNAEIKKLSITFINDFVGDGVKRGTTKRVHLCGGDKHKNPKVLAEKNPQKRSLNANAQNSGNKRAKLVQSGIDRFFNPVNIPNTENRR